MKTAEEIDKEDEKVCGLYEKWQEWEEDVIEAECCLAKAILNRRKYYLAYCEARQEQRKNENT